MQTTQRNRGASFHRILDFNAENPPTNVAATALVASLTTTTAAFDALATDQDLGLGTVHGAVVDRKQLKKDLVSFLKSLGEVARVLDPVAYPGIGAEMRLGRATSSYSALVVRGRAYHTALVPAKQAFIDHGFAATVDVDLEAAINALETATSRKNNGRAVHIGGTAGIAAICTTGVAIVRKLDAILSRVFKNDPVKLAAWKAARRVERNPAPAEPEPAPTAPVTPPVEPPASGS